MVQESVLSIVYAVSRDSMRGEPVSGSNADDATFWDLNRLEESLSEHIEPGYVTSFKRAVTAVRQK